MSFKIEVVTSKVYSKSKRFLQIMILVSFDVGNLQFTAQDPIAKPNVAGYGFPPLTKSNETDNSTHQSFKKCLLTRKIITPWTGASAYKHILHSLLNG